MKNSWIKLYHEILSDPKMGMMSDHLYRRTIELFLLAGQEGKDGLLPDISGIAWSLHTTTKDIQTVINSLIKLDIVEENFNPMSQYSEKELPKRYCVKHFEKRQKSEQTKSESNRAYYEKQKLKKSEIQTESDSEIQTEIQYVDKDIDKDKDKEKIKKEIRERENKTENSDAVASETLAKTKPQKHRHGNFGHVFLSDEEYEKLTERFTDLPQRIQNLDDYLENNPSKKYANHYLTILKWAEKDAQKQPTLPQPKRKYSFTEVGEMIKRGEL